MLNSVQEAEVATIHPWALSTSNQRSSGDQLRGVSVPDAPAAALLATPAGGRRGALGMMTGDFVAVCGDEDQREGFDAVVTCFFIDTAHNIVEYLEVRTRCDYSSLRLQTARDLHKLCAGSRSYACAACGADCKVPCARLSE
jgi:carnosine N-methyltransferase